MITFRECLELAESSTGESGRKRLPSRGPSSNKETRDRNKENVSRRAALKKAGFKHSPDDHDRQKIEVPSSSDHHFTSIKTHRNQSDFAKNQLFNKSEFGKVERTLSRVKELKAIRKQLGGDRTSKPVHDVSIFSKKSTTTKNDPKELISRGKSFKNELKAVPDSIKKSGGKAGDKVAGRPLEIQKMPNTMSAREKRKLKTKGAKKRGKMYHQELGGSETNPRTRLNVGNLK